MNDDFAPLTCIPLEPSTTFVRSPEPPRIVHIDDPAVDVMTDFSVINPVTVKPKVPIDIALDKMKTTGVRLLIVTNDEEQIIGVVTSMDIQGEKPIEIVQETRMPRSEITVSMIMTPQSRIVALNMGSLTNAEVGHVAETLRQLERQHLLVVKIDPGTKTQQVCGMFSSSQISKQLGRDVSKVAAHAHSLAEMLHERS